MNFENVDFDKLTAIIDSRRAERGLSISDIAEALQWSKSMTHMYVRGKRRGVSSRMMELLSFLEISESEFPLLGQQPSRPKGKNIFVSYSHRDKEYLTRLMVHLKPLERQGLIDPWVDTRLLAGDKWKKEIESGLKKARVAVLLVSADFLASDFIIENELPPLLHAAEEKGTLIIPVILKPCRFTREKNLREFQSINPPDEPLSLVDENERELVYDTIAQRIEDVLDGG